ncbi:50S ribosomal protein L18 [Lignipirellula cremea]|uniref:Large ribosomal subunit protein uL18 n=1 Tax=Lignipirellula cremea TaxID=2528010 RepID=A0A518DMY0_9BACT|nr:50S ribosomal protein L18 [Lignipirellula cremea]QDU93194.1 50S ribosomal protein L18 [Lignipirellula cremea]
MKKEKDKQRKRIRRRFHVRNKVRGDASRPRLCVVRTLQHITGQLVDDETGTTLVSASTNEKDLRAQITYGGNCDAATAIGKLIAERAKAKGISLARFDRGASKYHGRVAALADAAREGGLQF